MWIATRNGIRRNGDICLAILGNSTLTQPIRNPFRWHQVPCYGMILTKLQLAYHNLEIETSCHRDIHRENRKCRKCRVCQMGQVESEQHLLTNVLHTYALQQLEFVIVYMYQSLQI